MEERTSSFAGIIEGYHNGRINHNSDLIRYHLGEIKDRCKKLGIEKNFPDTIKNWGEISKLTAMGEYINSQIIFGKVTDKRSLKPIAYNYIQLAILIGDYFSEKTAFKLGETIVNLN